MIVATAGHVDHGKTSLVRALTGVDTDCLAEEQARGMTIDLGFAHAALAPGLAVGFIDVPGHERFVRNMLAGVAAIDLALLVVAADDGPMPQTREHLAILQLLAVPHLLVVLSKADRVDAARLAQAGEELHMLLAGGPFAAATVLPVATPTGSGLPAVRQHLVAAAQALQARPMAGHFRLAVDRSFLVAGAGRVVTGAVLSGRVAVGDMLRLQTPQMQQGASLRVRGLQVQGLQADAAQAGQRCALNLAGAELKRGEAGRGDWLLAEAAPPLTDRLDVQLQWLPGNGQPPGPRAMLQLHLGAAAVPARVSALGDAALGDAALDRSATAPGRAGLARLRLARPVAAAWGDRFILRDAAANRTLAGGWVVDPFGPERGSSQPLRLAQLAALARPDPAQALAAWVDAAPLAADLGHFAAARNLRDDEAAVLHKDLALQVIASAAGPLGLRADAWAGWQQRLLQAVDAWHAAQPDSVGPDDAALRQALGLGGTVAAQAVLRAAIATVVAGGALQRLGLRCCRPGHQPVLAAADAALLAQCGALLQPAGLRPPIVGDLASALGLPLPELLPFLGRMGARGLLVQVAPNRWFLPETVADLAAAARALAAAHADGAVDAAAYRDRTGIGRNLTVQVLEFLDRAGITRFDGKRHWLRGGLLSACD